MGRDAGPYTLRELLPLAKARAEYDWGHTAWLTWHVVLANFAGQTPPRLDDFHPLRLAERKRRGEPVPTDGRRTADDCRAFAKALMKREQRKTSGKALASVPEGKP